MKPDLRTRTQVSPVTTEGIIGATGCTSGYSSYSYNGPSYSTCNYYYQMAANSACSKILDNCR